MEVRKRPRQSGLRPADHQGPGSGVEVNAWPVGRNVQSPPGYHAAFTSRLSSSRSLYTANCSVALVTSPRTAPVARQHSGGERCRWSRTPVEAQYQRVNAGRCPNCEGGLATSGFRSRNTVAPGGRGYCAFLVALDLGVPIWRSPEPRRPMAMSMSEFAAAEPLRLLPDLAAGFRQDLSGLEDRELLALASSLPQSSERRAAARDLLVARYR